MKGLGVIINVLAVIIGGCVGTIFRGKPQARYQELMLRVCGVVVTVVAIMGVIDGLFVFAEKQIEVTGSLLIIFALIIGTVLGDALDIDGIFNSLGRAFKRMFYGDSKKAPKNRKSPVPRVAEAAEATGVEGRKPLRRLAELPVYNLPSERSGHRFVDGFVMASLFVSMNSMVLRGAVAEAGGDHTLFLYKSILDAVVVLTLAVVYGNGVCFCAIPLALCEGMMTGLVGGAPEFFTDKLVGQLCVIGAVIILCVGIQLAFCKKLKPANIIPSFLIPVIYYWANEITAKLLDGAGK